MEKDSPSKSSVAELAGRFKGHALPKPGSNEERPIRRRPPSSLRLNTQKHQDNDDGDSDKPAVVSPLPFKVKMKKNSAMIEKLQANLALSPTALLPSPKSPEVRLQPMLLPSATSDSSPSPASPLSPTALRPSLQSSEEEETVSFESPPEGPPLPSINKSRARLSFKRRPPTRLHRRSCSDLDNLSPGDPPPGSPEANGGDEDTVFHVISQGVGEEGEGEGGAQREDSDSKQPPDAPKVPEGRGQGEEEEEKDLTRAEDKVDPALSENATAGADRASPDGQTSSPGQQEEAAAAAQTLEEQPEEQQQREKERPQCEGNEAACEPPYY